MKNRIRKASALTMALLCAGSILLCSCDGAGKETEDTLTPATTSVETTETTTETTKPNPRDTTPYKALPLDGEKEHHFITSDYCFYESKKYVLFFDKDLDIPGDFAGNLDILVDEVENKLGLTYAPEAFAEDTVPDINIYLAGNKPWEDWCIDGKLPLFVCVDREDKGYGTIGYDTHIIVSQYELFSKDFWNSVPSYKDNPGRRTDYVAYQNIAKAIAQSIVMRNFKNQPSTIISSGISEYISRTVIDSVADKSPSLSEVKKKRFLYDDPIPEIITAKNAETVFAADYDDAKTNTMDIGAARVYGRYLCQFLNEQYGPDFFKKIYDTAEAYSSSNDYVLILKNTFGEDVFTKFGEWCKKNNIMQQTSAVF